MNIWMAFKLIFLPNFIQKGDEYWELSTECFYIFQNVCNFFFLDFARIFHSVLYFMLINSREVGIVVLISPNVFLWVYVHPNYMQLSSMSSVAVLISINLLNSYRLLTGRLQDHKRFTGFCLTKDGVSEV